MSFFICFCIIIQEKPLYVINNSKGIFMTNVIKLGTTNRRSDIQTLVTRINEVINEVKVSPQAWEPHLVNALSEKELETINTEQFQPLLSAIRYAPYVLDNMLTDTLMLDAAGVFDVQVGFDGTASAEPLASIEFKMGKEPTMTHIPPISISVTIMKADESESPYDLLVKHINCPVVTEMKWGGNGTPRAGAMLPRVVLRILDNLSRMADVNNSGYGNRTVDNKLVLMFSRPLTNGLIATCSVCINLDIYDVVI